MTTSEHAWRRVLRRSSPTLRHSGKLLHLGIGRAHSRTEIIALIHNNDATIANQSTGEIHAHFTLDPTRGYQRKSG
ncbi:hypothetical protein G3N18_15010 [Microbacterium sp. 2C]|uniref:hypothetical protein n=1 Tax=Microbacterium paulum TaxID=2707006 RepID=UPI0018C27F6E|nr:hypothetical protein [Microbacterium paulum]MBG0719346.1 hypothetical protein [Microbacterium paulum]